MIDYRENNRQDVKSWKTSDFYLFIIKDFFSWKSLSYTKINIIFLWLPPSQQNRFETAAMPRLHLNHLISSLLSYTDTQFIRLKRAFNTNQKQRDQINLWYNYRASKWATVRWIWLEAVYLAWEQPAWASRIGQTWHTCKHYSCHRDADANSSAAL